MVLQADTDPKVTTQLAQTAKLRFIWGMLRSIPLATWVMAQHMLGWSEQSAHVDLRTRLVVELGRTLAGGGSEPVSIAEMQALTLRPRGVPTDTWISTYTSPPPPETGAVDAVMGAVSDMVRLDANADAVPPTIRRPEYVPIEAEWTVYRPGAAAPSEMSEGDKYKVMMGSDVSVARTTILYFHGGAYTLFDPESHRPYLKQLCKRTCGRGYSVRYRLSPQAVFPAALLDAFVSYLTLPYPPPDAFHEPVKPEHIVISGDSAGGNLTLALLQLLLQLGRTKVRVAWHGQDRDVPLPAGAACNSPWLDLTHSFTGCDGSRPSKYDIMPTVSISEGGWMPHRRPDHLWPTQPARRTFYADDHLMAHPLVSLVSTRPEDWVGAPPVFICTGWEQLSTEDRVLARRLATRVPGGGVRVVFAEYEAMPHCFAMMVPHAAPAQHCWHAWARFIRQCTLAPADIRSSAVRINAKTLAEEPVEFEELLDFSDDEARDIFEKQNSLFKVAPRL